MEDHEIQEIATWLMDRGLKTLRVSRMSTGEILLTIQLTPPDL